jgi:hypothetical protein
MIGTTRSRVSFFMNKPRKLGFIEYNGKIDVHNSLLNVILYDKPEINTRDTGRCYLVSFIRMILLRLSRTLVPLICL